MIGDGMTEYFKSSIYFYDINIPEGRGSSLLSFQSQELKIKAG